MHQVVVAPVGAHSAKPDEVHRRIERLLVGPYLELFARNPRPGWQTWGDELPPAMAAATADDVEIPEFLRRDKPMEPAEWTLPGALDD